MLQHGHHLQRGRPRGRHSQRGHKTQTARISTVASVPPTTTAHWHSLTVASLSPSLHTRTACAANVLLLCCVRNNSATKRVAAESGLLCVLVTKGCRSAGQAGSVHDG